MSWAVSYDSNWNRDLGNWKITDTRPIQSTNEKWLAKPSYYFAKKCRVASHWHVYYRRQSTNKGRIES